ncbi:hypothetical protein POM88_026443 [Heracleum sosnowskyi]|uniref:Uncharacterized protein n=1 Tax=Heracleum sosnowskyi TaxID=360622 RepID=A0AAD8MP73_9APIA|nr:hypothetical protein POM88_026443 [Heracleum sosnowskyi]
MVVGEEGNGGNEMTGEEENVSNLDDTELAKTRGKKGKKPTKKAAKKPPTKTQSKTSSFKSNIPPPISPQTAFKSLTVRRSPRFSPVPNTSQNDSTIITSSISDQGLFRRKIPRTTAKRKGLLYSSSQKQGNGSEDNVTENVETDEGEREYAKRQKGKRKVEEFGEPDDRKKIVKRKVDFDDSENENVFDDVLDDVPDDVLFDEDDEYYQMPKIMFQTMLNVLG